MHPPFSAHVRTHSRAWKKRKERAIKFLHMSETELLISSLPISVEGHSLFPSSCLASNSGAILDPFLSFTSQFEFIRKCFWLYFAETFYLFTCFKKICNWLLEQSYDSLARLIPVWFNMVLASVDYLLLFKLWFSWFLVWWVVFHCILVISVIIRRRSIIGSSISAGSCPA